MFTESPHSHLALKALGEQLATRKAELMAATNDEKRPVYGASSSAVVTMASASHRANAVLTRSNQHIQLENLIPDGDSLIVRRVCGLGHP